MKRVLDDQQEYLYVKKIVKLEKVNRHLASRLVSFPSIRPAPPQLYYVIRSLLWRITYIYPHFFFTSLPSNAIYLYKR